MACIVNQMVEHSSFSLDRVFHALSDSTRRHMIRSLAGRPQSVTELAEPFRGAMSLAAASKHLKVLENADLIRRSIKGRVHLCSLNGAAIQAAESWMEPYGRFWHERLDALEDVIAAGGDQQ
jgi:DNA-binding transcriptional ArsR family regulator